MEHNVQGLLKFSEFLNKFREVERVIRVGGQDRWENDVEHSYQLAMLAWYIVSSTESDLDKDLVLKYALVHDLVEVYAGDTFTYAVDKQIQHGESKEDRERAEKERDKMVADKEKREKDACRRIQQEFSDFPEMCKLIEKYEDKTDEESKFVYALDKIQPMLQIYLDNGRTWREKGITIKMLYENKKAKVAVSEVVKKYFEEIFSILEEEKDRLF